MALGAAPRDPHAPAMPRHVKVGAEEYSSLDGASLKPLRSWAGRVPSMEVAIADLAAYLRSRGFRPFRPLIPAGSRPEGRVSAKLTAVRETETGLRLPWRPKMVSGLLSVELVGAMASHKTVHGTSPDAPRLVYNLKATVSGGVAVFKKDRWQSRPKASFEKLMPGVADGVVAALNRSAANQSGPPKL